MNLSMKDTVGFIGSSLLVAYIAYLSQWMPVWIWVVLGGVLILTMSITMQFLKKPIYCENVKKTDTQSSTSIGADDVNILKLFMGLRRTGPLPKALGQIYLLLSQVGNRGVKEYCIEVLGYSNKQFNSAFTSAERALLNGVWDPMQFDITLLYKLLQRVCGLASYGDSKWNTPGDTIEYYLYTIKTERNELAHEGVQIDDAQLNKKFNHLENILVKIFDKINKKLFAPGNVTEEFKCAAILSLKNICTAHVITPQTLEDCRALLNSAKEEILTKVISLARRALHHRYQTLKSASPITWASHFSQNIMDINQLFTELELEDSHTPVNLEEMISLSSLVILQGLPGSGKSAVVRFFANCWSGPSQKYTELNRKDIFLLIQCRYITCGDLISFLKNETLYEALENVASEDVVSLLKGAELYICIDGYDEAGPKAKELLQQILKLFPDAHFLLTTRPEFTDDLKIECHKYFKVDRIPVINILGFNENNRKEYVKRVFTHLKEGIKGDDFSSSDDVQTQNQESLDAFYNFLRDKEGLLGALTRLPLTIAFLVILWVDDVDNVTSATTATQIYNQLLKLMIRRVVERLRQRSEERRTSHILTRKCNKWVIELGKEAWAALKSNKTCLSNSSTDNLMDKCDEQKLDITEMFSTLLISDSQCTITTSSLVWSFFHKTLQEFLAALYISHTITEAGCNIEEIFMYKTDSEGWSTSKLEDSNTVLSFVSGTLSETGNMTNTRAKSILRVAEAACTSYKAHALIMARILLETKCHSDIVNEVSHMQFIIDEITAETCYLIHPLLNHTDSIMDTYVNIEVNKVNTDLVSFVGESCKKLNHFKPKFKFTNLEDMNMTLTLLSELDIANHSNNFSVSITFYTNQFTGLAGEDENTVITSFPEFPFYIQRNMKQIIAMHGDHTNAVVEENSENNTVQILQNVKYEIIGIVHTEHVLLTNWLIKNTQCKLSSFITFDGSGVSQTTLEVLKYGYNTIWHFQPRIRWLKTFDEIATLVKFLQQLGTSDHIQNDVFLSLSFSNPLSLPARAGIFSSRPKGTKSVSEILSDHPELNNFNKDSNLNVSAAYIIEYINEVQPDQVRMASWLVRHTQCRLAKDLTIHVKEITQDILDLIEWEYEHWRFNPYFKFRSLSELMKGAEYLLNYLEHLNVYNYELDALLELSFSAPTSLAANAIPPYPSPPPPFKRH